MKLNLIKAENMRKAMDKMHECLGPNALIYRTKHTEFGVEVLAGMGDRDAEVSAVEMNEAELNAYLSKPGTRQVDAQLAELSSHIRSLNDKIQTLSHSTKAASPVTELTQSCYDTLMQYGFSLASADAIFADRVKRKKTIPNMSDFIWKTLEKVLTIANHELIEQSGFCAIVGPTGVGKTTTIVKMAMRYVKRYGSEGLGIITTDPGDMNIKNMLTHYCHQLKIDLEYAHSARDLNHSLTNMKHKKLVLIDTYGVSQNDQAALAALHTLLSACQKKVSIYLALPCQHQEDVNHDIITRFNFQHLDGCILTKMDEAHNVCPAVTLAIRYELPVAYVCFGQDVENDIRYPSQSYLISKMMMTHDPIFTVDEPIQKSVFRFEPSWLLGRGLVS